MKVLKTNSH